MGSQHRRRSNIGRYEDSEDCAMGGGTNSRYSDEMIQALAPLAGAPKSREDGRVEDEPETRY